MAYRMALWPLCTSRKGPEVLTLVIDEVFTLGGAAALIELLTTLPANVAVRVQFRPRAVIDSLAATQLVSALALSPARDVALLGLSYERQHPAELPLLEGDELTRPASR